MKVPPYLLGTPLIAAAIALSGCGGDIAPADGESAGPEDGADQAPMSSGNDGGEAMSTIQISTDAFEPGGPIPAKFTADGADVSPALRFAGVPETAKSLAILCDDPDAPRPQPWVHWIIYNIPAGSAGLPEGVPRDALLAEPAGARQGMNSWPSENIGYRGPAPPKGVHRYYFKLYALDTVLNLPPQTADKQDLLTAMEGHIVGQAEIMGTYERVRETR